MDKPYKLLVEFEALVGLGPTQACQVLGIAYSTYAAYRNGGRPLQPYHRNHIEVIGRLSRRALSQLIDERTNGEKN
jgi:hypothetical protein